MIRSRWSIQLQVCVRVVTVGKVSILDFRVMGTREAARQLHIPPSTLLNWLQGHERQGVWYEPILREQPAEHGDITWGEMVEARYLRAYRQRQVPMQRLRPFIADLRREFGVPYPLAHFKPFIDEHRRLLVEAQERAGLPDELRVVYEVPSGQILLDPRVTDFLARIDFSQTTGEAERMHPAGRTSPVVMDPRKSSGAAIVQGIRTEVLAELADAHVPVDEIALDFDLPVEVVKAALAYEWAAA